MAAYNAEMNRRLYDAAGRLSRGRAAAANGAFWGSIHGTLVHILWGDDQWMSRFDNWPRPATPIKESDHLSRTWPSCARRATRPMPISRAGPRRSTDTGSTRTWSGSAAPPTARSPPKRLLVTHFFNHQTHHRGQAHALITAAGQKTGDTDLFLIIPEIVE